MTTSAKTKTHASAIDYVVKDIGLAEWGRKEIAIAETEMPGLMATREEFGPQQYWNYTHRIFEWADGGGPNMILDDGGDATLLLHLGMQAESNAGVIAHPGNEEEEVLFAAIGKRLKERPGWYSSVTKNIKGVTEETTTGVHRLYQMAREGW